MKITFNVEHNDYLDYVISTDEHGELIENHIKPGDILEEVQLHSYFIHYWNKEVAGKKAKELNHINSDLYSFLGEIIKIREESFEVIVDCTLPVRMCLDEDCVSRWNIKKGDFIWGVFRLKGYICYDDYTLKEKIKGRVVEIERYKTPWDNYIIFITLETM